ncbi:hypothetical protein ABZ366_05570 [Streptomyces sp. NPDC005904]|uniref:hypothetical protein n=1 Tax=Streptomyces sp. NPDC005904 TaxID=3154570 RepID=UPI0033E16C05
MSAPPSGRVTWIYGPEAAAHLLEGRIRAHQADCPGCGPGKCEERARLCRALRGVPSLLKRYEPSEEDCR